MNFGPPPLKYYIVICHMLYSDVVIHLGGFTSYEVGLLLNIVEE